MSVDITTGDIFKSECEVICDANNAIGISGAGLAGAFAKRYPILAKAYNQTCKNLQMAAIDEDGSPILLPPMIYAKNIYDNDDYAVIKFPTMIYPGSKTKSEDIDQNLKSLKELLDGTEYTKIALPALGCGIGMFSFEKLLELVRNHFEDGRYSISLHRPI